MDQMCTIVCQEAILSNFVSFKNIKKLLLIVLMLI